MKDILDKFSAIFGGFIKLMYKFLRMFGATEEGNTNGSELSDAVKEFTDTIGNL